MEATFFQGANRRVTIGSPTKQCSNGRIVFPIKMPLSGESFIGMPDWVGTGYTAVAQNFTEVDPEVQQVSDITLAFSNDKPAGELFEPPSAKVPGAELKVFKIKRTEDPDDPEVELHFKAFAPFTRDFWAWIGEMTGKEVYMAFPSSLGGTVKAAPAEQIQLTEAEQIEADRREALKPEHDEEFATPSLADEFGPDYQEQVRQSMGAPEPMPEGIRHVDARPAARGRRGKGNGSTLAVN